MTTLSWRFGVLGVVVASAWSTIFFQPRPHVASWSVESVRTLEKSSPTRSRLASGESRFSAMAEEIRPIRFKESLTPAPTLEEIKRRGFVTFLIPQGATSYFLYRGEQMGFEYELALDFAKSLGVELEVMTPLPGVEPTALLRSGTVDIAAGLVIDDKNDLGSLIPSISYLDVTSQILTSPKSAPLRGATPLSGRTIAIRPNALYAQQALFAASAPFSLPILNVVQSEDGIVGAMRMMTQGKANAILTTTPLADVAKKLYPGRLQVAWTLPDTARTVWTIRSGSPRLLDTINTFLAQAVQSGRRKILFEKYFVTTAHLQNNRRKQEVTLISKRLSRYDRLIARHAEEAGFDWRFIAALIFEESRFNHDRVSGAGASGLMQIRKIAAQDIGMKDYSQPASNIEAGIKYLQMLARQFRHSPLEDRLALVLASYVMGPGHLEDAQSLARALGYDPNKWKDSMERILPLLEKPKYYKKLQYGVAQGREAVRYVNAIRKRYNLYSQYVARELPEARSHRKGIHQAASAAG